MADKEIWKNATKGTALVNVYDNKGTEVQKVVASGKTIAISEEERLYLNTDRAMHPGRDIFSSGTMVPVKLLESTSDRAKIESNPNQLSESDLADLLTLQWKKFDTALEEITNTQALGRLYDIANADPSTTVRQFDTIKARILELDPTYLFDD